MLTQMERKVFKLIAKGRTIRDVAKILFIQESTVQTHRAAAYRKTQVANNVEAAHYALYHKLIVNIYEPKDPVIPPITQDVDTEEDKLVDIDNT